MKNSQEFSDISYWFSEAKITFKLWFAVFAQRKCRWISTAFQSRKSSSNYDTLFFHRENTHHTIMRFFSTEKMLLNFLLIFRLQNNAFFFRLRKCRWIFYCFSEPKMIIKLWCAVFPQKKCRWISCCFSESKIIIKLWCAVFHRENVGEFLTAFQSRKWTSNYDALFFHRENVAEFLVAFQSRK